MPASWLQSDCVELKSHPAPTCWAKTRASIGLCGIEMKLAAQARIALGKLQSDCVELKFNRYTPSAAVYEGFNRTVWN